MFCFGKNITKFFFDWPLSQKLWVGLACIRFVSLLNFYRLFVGVSEEFQTKNPKGEDLKSANFCFFLPQNLAQCLSNTSFSFLLNFSKFKMLIFFLFWTFSFNVILVRFQHFLQREADMNLNENLVCLRLFNLKVNCIFFFKFAVQMEETR